MPRDCNLPRPDPSHVVTVPLAALETLIESAAAVACDPEFAEEGCMTCQLAAALEPVKEALR